MYMGEFPALSSFSPIPHRYDGKYMDPVKLVRLLRDQYGPSNFRIDLQLDQYLVYVMPAKLQHATLTDAQINTCRKRY
ncbi:hypothetical protein BJX63DRAFT_415167 [Aspergillus granulosus]|uniref:Uncharacterized protein n=1 Tax=Aspergillus granulosus TaxID=176169 RepID=A0ABR4GV00_9EURO